MVWTREPIKAPVVGRVVGNACSRVASGGSNRSARRSVIAERRVGRQRGAGGSGKPAGVIDPRSVVRSVAGARASAIGSAGAAKRCSWRRPNRKRPARASAQPKILKQFPVAVLAAMSFSYLQHVRRCRSSVRAVAAELYGVCGSGKRVGVGVDGACGPAVVEHRRESAGWSPHIEAGHGRCVFSVCPKNGGRSGRVRFTPAPRFLSSERWVRGGSARVQRIDAGLANG